MNNNH